MIEEFKKEIEHGSWEDDLDRQFAHLDRFCWVVIIFAALYFAPVLCGIIMREAMR